MEEPIMRISNNISIANTNKQNLKTSNQASPSFGSYNLPCHLIDDLEKYKTIMPFTDQIESAQFGLKNLIPENKESYRPILQENLTKITDEAGVNLDFLEIASSDTGEPQLNVVISNLSMPKDKNQTVQSISLFDIGNFFRLKSRIEGGIQNFIDAAILESLRKKGCKTLIDSTVESMLKESGPVKPVEFTKEDLTPKELQNNINLSVEEIFQTSHMD